MALRHDINKMRGLGLNQFLAMLFGLCNTSGMSVRLMNSVLWGQGLTYETCPLYFDNMIIVRWIFQQPAKSVQPVPTSPPYTQLGNVPVHREGGEVYDSCCTARSNSHQPRKAGNWIGMANTKEQTLRFDLPGLVQQVQVSHCWIH
jgi:hypothetical protein